MLVDQCQELDHTKQMLIRSIDGLPDRTRPISLILDFVEIDAKKQGAKVQVFLCSESGLKRLAWEFDIQPDAAKLVLESKEFLINNETKYIDIKVCAEGQDRQVIGKVSTSVNDLIEHHLIKPEEVMVLR